MPVRTRNRRSFIAAAATAAAALPLRGSAQAAPAVVKLGSIPTDDMTPIVYGIKAGIFAKAGLDIEITKMTSGAAVTAAVISGALDLGKSSVATLFAAHDKGLPITLLAASTLYDPAKPYAGFLVSKDGKVKSGADLNGQLIGTGALGDVASLGLLVWVDKTGGNSKTLKFVEIPSSAAAAAVEQNRVAASEASDPHYASAIASGRARGINVFDAIGSLWVLSAWFTTRDFSAKHPELIRAFTRAYAEAATYSNAHPAETAPLMAEFTGIELPVIQKMNRSISGITIQAGQFQPVIDAAAKYGYIKKGFPASELIDPNAGR